MQNVLFVLLDGMEDDPNPALGGRKPYEVANMPFIRRKAPHLSWTTGRGYTQLFLNEFWTGYPPDITRAAIEAYGLGIDMSEGRMAFRMSPAFIKDDMVRWAYGIDDRVDELQDCVRKNIHHLDGTNPQIEYSVHGRSVITMEFDGAPHNGPQAPVDGPYIPVEGKLGDLILKVAEELDGLTIYPWGVGKIGSLHPPFPCVEHLTAISNSPTALGIAATLGHEIKFIADIEDRFPAAREALKKGHVFLHIDEVDEYSHQKDHMKKIQVLEKVDRLFEEYFSDAENIVFFVDHGTSCVTGTHILMNVPFRTTKPVFEEEGLVELASLVPTFMEKIQ